MTSFHWPTCLRRILSPSAALGITCLTSMLVPVQAQNGDKAGEVQMERVPADRIPPAPVLPPEKALQSFKLQPGFRMEIVAAEPLVEAPVIAQFDAEGRMWVVEMRGFMPNPDGKGEEEKNGRISVLEDTDGDGRMDKRTTFMDGLVLPRAMALVNGGVLVGEPPKLWFLKDTNGDLKADEHVEVATDYGSRENPEHTSNGMLVALDNWIYSANHTTRFRYTEGSWKREPTVFRGQWGITQDDQGRIFFNSNSDQLRADLTPSHYFARNRHLQGVLALNHPVAKDQSVWPGRVNPGVNRGYQKATLRDDGTLATFTGACGPAIYRGDQFPSEFLGNAFLCEPTGNLIRRNLLSESNNVIQARNAYDRTEFLTSTDERFRPVNLSNGPDGALYVVDMYRGLIQHRIYLTSYLRKQATSRGLEKGLEYGRIYRVVHEASPRRKFVSMAKAGTPALIDTLSHANGWHRDTAQRLLIERQDSSSSTALRDLVKNNPTPMARLHGLWTLEGLGLLDRPTLLAAIGDRDERVAAAAIRLSEPFIAGGAEGEFLPRLLPMMEDTRHAVRLQLAFSLSAMARPDVESAISNLLLREPRNTLIREAVVSGLSGREIEFAGLLAGRNLDAGSQQALAPLFALLSKSAWLEGRGTRVQQLIKIIGELPEGSPAQLALLEGLSAGGPKPGSKNTVKPKPVKLGGDPAFLLALQKSKNTEIATAARNAAELLVWPGKPGYVEPKVTPLTKEEQARFDEGKPFYAATCGACHQPNGQGQEGLAPPLVDSEWVVGSADRLIRIVLHGVRGKISVKGKTYTLDMPPLGVLDDDQIANVLTYIRREWEHTASPVSKEQVAKIREATMDRLEGWTEEELLKIP